MVTPRSLIDTRKTTNHVFLAGSTGSMVAANANDVWGAVGLLREKEYAPYVDGDQPQGVAMFISTERAGATNWMFVAGLDYRGRYIDEVIQLDGRNKKQLQNNYFRVFHLENLEAPILPAAPSDPNAVFVFRDTTVTTGGRPTNLTKIEAYIGSFPTYGLPVAQQTQFTVPFDHRGYIENYLVSANWEVADTRAIFYIMTSPAGRTKTAGQSFYWNSVDTITLNTSGTSNRIVGKDGKDNKGIPLDPGTDVVIKAFVAVATYIVAASFTIRLERIR